MVLIFMKQLWIASGVIASQIGIGFVISFSSSLLPALRANDSDIKVDTKSESWIASSVAISTPVGFLVSSFLMDKYGRKIAFSHMILPGIIGWITIYFSKSISSIIIGRILGGFTAGAIVTLGAIIIGEFTSAEHRSMFLNMKTAGNCMGNLFSHIAGAYLDWRTLCLVSLIPFVLSILNVIVWPESPAWLFYKNNPKESEAAFRWLRGKNKKSAEEYSIFVQAQMEKLAIQKENKDNIIFKFLKSFREKDLYKPLLLIVFCGMLIEACGRHWYTAFTKDIITMVLGEHAYKSNGFTYTLIIDSISLVGTVLSCILVKFYRRRTLLFSSGITSIFILSSIIVYLYLVTLEIISNEKSWIPLSMFIMYFIIVNIGCTTMSVALISEIFPLRHRAFGTSVAGIILSFGLFLSLQSTPFLMHNFNLEGMLLANAVVFAVGLLYLYFMMPETSNRTLQEIEDFFTNGFFMDEENAKNKIETDPMMVKS